jgi:hypothetical protein
MQFDFQGEPVIGFVMERIGGYEVDHFLAQNKHSSRAKMMLVRKNYEAFINVCGIDK